MNHTFDEWEEKLFVFQSTNIGPPPAHAQMHHEQEMLFY